jgi:hypothetical protein
LEGSEVWTVGLAPRSSFRKLGRLRGFVREHEDDWVRCKDEEEERGEEEEKEGSNDEEEGGGASQVLSFKSGLDGFL